MASMQNVGLASMSNIGLACRLNVGMLSYGSRRCFRGLMPPIRSGSP